MFRVLCVEFKLVTIPYFLDEMQPYEVKELVKVIGYCDRTSWELTRLLMCVEALTHSRKKIVPKDIMKFAWDEQPKEKGNLNITDEDKERILRHAETIKNKYLSKTHG